MFSHSINRQYRDSSGVQITGSETVAADTEWNFDGAIPPSTTNQLVTWTAIVANLKTVSIYSDVAVTIKTNSSGSPQETIAIAAGYNLIWSLSSDGAGKIPFSGNITALYVTNATTGAANIKVRALAHEGA